MKTIKAICLSLTLLGGASLLPGPVAAQPAAPSPAPMTNVVRLTTDYLAQLTDEMRTNNPALRAAYSRTNAAAASLNAVRTWEDPMARIGGMAAREQLRADDGDIIYGVGQKLPLFGKPQSARRVARAEVAAEIANADYLFQTHRSELARVAFRTALADQVVAIGEQDVAWLDTLAPATESKFRSGEATLVETLLLENERAKRATQLQSDRNQLTHERVSLNRLLNRDLQSPWPRLELPPLPGGVAFNPQLVGFALKNEPKIRMLREQIHQAEATVDLTRRERFPDVNVGLEARNYSGDGSFRQGMLVFDMNLPWGNNGKYRNALRREQSRLEAAEFELADYQSSVREDVHRLAIRIDAARRDALLYRDQIIPRTQSALEATRSGWESGRNSFRDLLDARRMLLEARLMYARAVAEQYQMMSELVLCCGLGDLGALEMIGAQPGAGPGENLNEK